MGEKEEVKVASAEGGADDVDDLVRVLSLDYIIT